MSIRLNKALRELNIGLQTAVEFLEKRNELGEVKAELNFKLSDEQYKALSDAFSQDKEVRNQAEKLFTKKTKEKKRAPEPKENRAESILESSRQQQYKPLGKIDLDSVGKAPVAQSAAPKTTETPKVTETAAVSPEPVNNAPKKEEKPVKVAPVVEKVQEKPAEPVAKQPETKVAEPVSKVEKQAKVAESQPAAEQPATTASTVFTLKSEQKFAANEPKVLGKIDLSALNQSTRPKKKTKEERRKEREDKLAQQHGERKKRVRINKERVDINAESANGGKSNNNAGGNQNNNAGGKK